jgi:SAM-dependent methyltransferase
MVGADHVAAVDPTEPFVEQCRLNVPGADVRLAPAEAIPFEDASFDRTLAQLVFHFVSDPIAAAGEMKRVTRPGGKVAACVWDMTGGMTMIRAYWEAAREADPDAPAETERFGGKSGQVADLWRAAGLRERRGDVASGVHALPGFRRALALLPPRRGADRRARRVARG